MFRRALILTTVLIMAVSPSASAVAASGGLLSRALTTVVGTGKTIGGLFGVRRVSPIVIQTSRPLPPQVILNDDTRSNTFTAGLTAEGGANRSYSWSAVVTLEEVAGGIDVRIERKGVAIILVLNYYEPGMYEFYVKARDKSGRAGTNSYKLLVRGVPKPEFFVVRQDIQITEYDSCFTREVRLGDCRRKAEETGEIINFGESIAVLIAGDGSYECDDLSSGDILNRTLNILNVNVPTRLGRIACVLTTRGDVMNEGTEDAIEGVDIRLGIRGPLSADVESSLEDVTFNPHPCHIPLELYVQSSNMENVLNLEGSIEGFESIAGYRMADAPEFNPPEAGFKVGKGRHLSARMLIRGGVGPYTVSCTGLDCTLDTVVGNSFGVEKDMWTHEGFNTTSIRVEDSCPRVNYRFWSLSFDVGCQLAPIGSGERFKYFVKYTEDSDSAGETTATHSLKDVLEIVASSTESFNFWDERPLDDGSGATYSLYEYCGIRPPLMLGVSAGDEDTCLEDVRSFKWRFTTSDPIGGEAILYLDKVIALWCRYEEDLRRENIVWQRPDGTFDLHDSVKRYCQFAVWDGRIGTRYDEDDSWSFDKNFTARTCYGLDGEVWCNNAPGDGGYMEMLWGRPEEWCEEPVLAVGGGSFGNELDERF